MAGKELFIQGGNSRAVYGLAFHPDGALAASGGMDAVGRMVFVFIHYTSSIVGYEKWQGNMEHAWAREAYFGD
jgi:hypothetical protein